MDVVPKQIAVICNYKLLEDRVGGMDYFYWAFDKKCKDQNIEVHWFFPNTANHGAYHTFNIIASKNETLEKCFLEFITTQKVYYSNVITHFIELCTPFYAQVKKFHKTNVIAVDHNPRPFVGYPLKKRLNKKIKGFLYSKYIDLFLGVSDYTSNAILKDFGGRLKSKTHTVYNGVLIDDIIPKVTTRLKLNPKFLVVSHLRYSKGIQDLIQAVSLLSVNLQSKIKIDVFGDGPYKNELMYLVKKQNLESAIIFRGSQSNLNQLYRNYDYLIQPTHMECFSLSILESLAANIPVVTTPVGGNLEIIANSYNGFIFETKNSKELSRLLTDLIIGEKEIKGNTRTLIENNFSIELMVKNHIKFIV